MMFWAEICSFIFYKFTSFFKVFIKLQIRLFKNLTTGKKTNV